MSAQSTAFEGPSTPDSDITDFKQRSSLSTASTERTTPGVLESSIEPKLSRSKLKKLIDDEKFAYSEKLDRIQIAVPCLITGLIVFSAYYINPSFEKFYSLQYKYPDSNLYDIGFDDIYFIFFCVINLTLVRSLLMSCIFKPCARLAGVTKFKPTQRFIEQSWSLFYYSISWCIGFYIYYHSDYFFNCVNIFKGWPHDKLSHLSKWYYLVQTSCWLQQILVLNVEEKRKDYFQMFSHHIITSLLCVGSYLFYFTRIGHVILLIMDVVDVFLSFAKILKYCGYHKFCDIMFVVFMISWFIFRHGAYNYLFWFACTRARTIMDGDCSKYVEGVTKICYTDTQIDFFLVLLGCLQVITIIWMFMILKVAFRVIRGDNADDVRSDSDESH